MPFSRPTLTQLRQQVAADIATAILGADALLRFSNLGITGDAQAALAHGHYGYLDWIAQQAAPYTATQEYLEAWAALVGIFRLAPTQATGSVTFSGADGAVLPAGTPLVRGDGQSFVTTAAGVISGGSAIVPAQAVADPSGLTGAWGDTDAGVAMTLGTAIAGVNSNGVVSSAIVGGADIETDDSLRARMLERYQQRPQGGSQSDYVGWALGVPGVTRAWVTPNGMGPGTVVIYIMLDGSESAHGGFPQGANGVAASEPRAAAATGDQLVVANAIYPQQPVTALVYVVAPTVNSVDFSISGIPAGSRSAAQQAISDLFLSEGAPGGVIILAHAWTAIAAVTGVNDFLITSPSADIFCPTGSLPVLGAVAWS